MAKEKREDAPQAPADEQPVAEGSLVIRIGRPSEATNSGVSVIHNTQKVTIPYDVDTVVSRGVYDILTHAVEPYPVKITGENGMKKTSVKMRPRWTVVVVKR